MINLLELDKKKILLIVVISLLLLYVDVAFLLKGQFKGIKELGPQITKLKTDLVVLRKDLAMMQQDLARKTPGVKPEKDSKVKKIYSEEQIPSFLQYISNVANKNNVSIIRMLPSKTSEGKAAKDLANFSPLLITLNLSCGYHGLGKFINELENAPSYLAVLEAKIIRDSGDSVRQNVNLVIKTYVKK